MADSRTQIDIEKLLCSCTDFKNYHSKCRPGHPSRLCKHLLAAMVENEARITDEMAPFIDIMKSRAGHEKGMPANHSHYGIFQSRGYVLVSDGTEQVRAYIGDQVYTFIVFEDSWKDGQTPEPPMADHLRYRIDTEGLAFGPGTGKYEPLIIIGDIKAFEKNNSAGSSRRKTNRKEDADGQPPANIHQKNREKRSLTEMIGVCKGVIADGRLCESEARFLANWLAANPDATASDLGRELLTRLDALWVNGPASEADLAGLKDWLGQITGIVCQKAAEVPVNFSSQVYFDDPEPEVIFPGKPADGTPRKVYEQMVKDRGGHVSKSLVMDLNYLVVCAAGSKDWNQSSFGTKIEEALKYKKRGCPIKIISEQCWLKGLQ